MKKKIIAVTGARSDYDLLYAVYKKLHEDPNFDFSLIITGPNLSETFGYTSQWIEKDGFKVACKIFNLVDSSQRIGRIVSIGNQISVLANVLLNENPDLVLVAGDREESISVTMTCAYLDIAVAHFFGGDVAKDGNIDNSTRYAASKYAHIHFPSLEEHRNNLLKMGEEDSRIFVVGNPALDRIKEIPIFSKNELYKELDVANKNINNYCVLIQHSIITQVELQTEHIKITLDSILKFDLHCFINYPNSDPGSSDIVKIFIEYSNKYPDKFTLFKNLDRVIYINLLRNSQFLIGNSSSGLLEVATLKLAAINVGDRQRNRLHAENVLFVDNDLIEISNAINKVLYDKEFHKILSNVVNPYGDGFSSNKIVKVLSDIKVDSNLIHKNITY
uniref:UDP-N-acetylglucosamine 2-epimerase n=1 Tax=Algoriphagus sp. TaxID=1872435 RepID=UPI004047258B